jgi:ribosomal protein S18 acetylase RimI-like enzyme
MSPYRLVLDANPTFEDAEFLAEPLYHYNVEQTGYDDGRMLTIWLYNDANERRAGLQGWTWGGSCYIRDLWVHPDLRGQGYGTQLLQAAEQEARARGCQLVVLESYSFQAPGFYQRHGYEVFAVLEDHPLGHHNYYLRKRLT